MGNACCVAARDKMVVPNAPAVETLQRNNMRYSPNWSFRWDNRGRVAGEETSLSWLSDGISHNDGSDIKSEFAFVSSEESPLDNFQTHSWQKSPASDQSFSRNSLTETGSEQITQKTNDSTDTVYYPSPAKLSLSLASQPSSFSTSPLSSQSHLPMPPASSSTLKLTPCPHLSKQVSDGRQIFGYTSPSRSSATEERLGNESQSDGWSMQAFSEMMAYSRRESCSYDNECVGLRRDKIDRHGNSKSSDHQNCGACSRSLSEKSFLSSQKIFGTTELSVAAILACGHVYHSECLEQMTSETDKFDPQCPICTLGEKKTLKLLEKALKADLELQAKHNKRLRNRVVDSDDFVIFDHNHKAAAAAGGYKGKSPKLISSTSLRSYSPKPFLARHFSFGSRSNNGKSPKENYSRSSLRKKGFFWTRSSIAYESEAQDSTNLYDV